MTSSSSLYGNTPSSPGNVSSSNLTTLYSGNAVTVPSNGNLVVPGTLTVNGCAILTDCTTFNLLPFTATTVNAFGSATTVSIGDSTGTTTINNQLATANYTFPVADGTAGQALGTDGAGNLTFITIGGGGGQTFGNITVAVVDNNTISTTTGDLDLTATAGVNVTTTGANSIVLSTDLAGGGAVLIGDGTQTGVVAANGAQDLLLLADPANPSGQATFQLEAATGDIRWGPGPTGTVRSVGDLMVLGTGSANTDITTNGAYNLKLSTNNLSNATYVELDNSTGSIFLNSPSGSIVVNIAGTGSNVLRRSATTGTISNTSIQQRNRTNALLAAMNGEGSATVFGVRDSALATSFYSRVGGTYSTTADYDIFFDTSNDNFTTSTRLATLRADQFELGSGTGGDQNITTAGAQYLLLNTNGGTTSSYIEIGSGVGSGIVLEAANSGTGVVQVTATGPIGGRTFLVTDLSSNLEFSALDGQIDSNNALGLTLTTSATNAPIQLITNGTGDIYLSADTTIVGDSNATATVTTNGTGNLQLTTNGGTNSGSIIIANGVNGNISVSPNGTGLVQISKDVELGTGIIKNKSGTPTAIQLQSNGGIGGSSLTVANLNITLTPDSVGNVIIDGGIWPGNSTSVTVNSVLTNDGSGNLSWALPGGGGSTFGNVSIGVDTDQTISTTSGNLILQTAAGVNSGTITIFSGSTGNITLEPNTTGDVHLNTDNVRIGDLNATATLSTRGTGNLVLTTNEGSAVEGNITLTNGADGNITLTPNGTGDVVLSADQVVVGDAAATATITSNGAGNLVLNTNSGTNAGSLTFAQGANQNITMAPNGSGVFLITGITAGVISPSPGTSAILGRHQATTSSTISNYSFNVQKQRTDILLAAMTAEPAVVAFSVRDSGSNNRVFARLAPTYQGTGTQPYWLFQTSVDNFTTTVQTLSIGGANAIWGALNFGYTHTTNGTGDLTLNTNSGTNAGSIVLTNGVNGNITIAPNGTGQTKVTNLNYNEVVYTAGTTTGTITPDCANGTIQSITLTGSITFNAFTTPISGETLTLIITQPAAGGPYTLTSTMLFAGGSKTLSTAANAIDILTVSYIGTTYYASLAKGFA
jgi:hypothetical protein